MFNERKSAGAQGTERGFVDIVDIDREAGLGEGKHQRNTDMAGSAHNGEIRDLRARRDGRWPAFRCDIQWIPLPPERALITANDCRGPQPSVGR